MRAFLVGLVLAAGCTNDPVYLPSPISLEAGMDDGTGMPSEARAQVQIPVVIETEEDAMERAEIQTRVGADVVVPYVRVGDLEVSVEWRINNLADLPGTATIQLNGANQFFEYDPVNVIISADDEAPPSPPLLGDIPLEIPANGELRGIFREDELREAAIDLDQITRANVNPFRATLVVDKQKDTIAQLAPLTYDEDGEPLPQEETGVAIPADAFAQLLRVDMVFRPTRRMVMNFTVRVRDVRGDLLHELGGDAFTDPEGMGELEPLNPAVYAAAPAAPTP